MFAGGSVTRADTVFATALSLGPVKAALRYITDLPRYPKRALLAINDSVIMLASLWLGFSIRYGYFYWPTSLDMVLVLALAPVIGVLTLFWFRMYRHVTRYMSGRSIPRIAGAMSLTTLMWAFIVLMSGVAGVPRLALVLFMTLSTFGIWGSRQFGGWLLRSTGSPIPAQADDRRIPVVIYGANETAVSMARAMEKSDRYLPDSFVDRNPTLWGQVVGGYKVYRPSKLEALIARNNIKEVLITLPDATRAERASVLREVEPLGIVVRTLPGLGEVAAGKASGSQFRAVEANDLLGRDPVPPNIDLMRQSVTGKNVLITGAGGSIGSELCVQVLRLAPQRLVLLDASENALFEIHQFLRDHQIYRDLTNTTLVDVLGSVTNERLVRDVLRTHDIETIYHAAAHKHVPILEHNAIQGLENNTFGTLTLAKAAAEAEVERFVLISTDKAVRPTNVMGASKRLAEVVLQTMADEGKHPTIFTMVRFGNVLDSSGSVVRRFRKQIADGGPVTVTHPDMIRYFMSIPEAASLVIQAGGMAHGGEVFVLDMGEPVKIDSLARSMIQLAGFRVKDAASPDGDIAIEYIGLRPGEKIREELLIGSDARPTDHPRIQTSREPFMTQARLDIELAALKVAMASGQLTAIQDVLTRIVEGYHNTERQAANILAEPDSLAYGWQKASSKAIH
jgi:FlaA1/EpsC-like NDP-sugar epimerase